MPKENRQERIFLQSLFSDSSFHKRYNKSYEDFIDKCQLKKVLEKSFNRISDKQVIHQINQLSNQTIEAYQSVWRETFQGTRFLPYLEMRLQTKRRLRINEYS
jgi:hypothetical protein